MSPSTSDPIVEVLKRTDGAQKPSLPGSMAANVSDEDVKGPPFGSHSLAVCSQNGRRTIPPKNSFRFIEFSSFSAAQVAVRFVPKMADSTKTKFQTIQLVLQVPAGDLLKFKYRTVVNETANERQFRRMGPGGLKDRYLVKYSLLQVKYRA